MEQDGAAGARFHRWIGDDLELRLHAAPPPRERAEELLRAWSQGRTIS